MVASVIKQKDVSSVESWEELCLSSMEISLEMTQAQMSMGEVKFYSGYI